MLTFLKILFSVIFAGMIAVVVTTSYESNLFTLIATWDPANSMAPWFSATLWDFYANVVFIFVWVAYKENNVLRSIVWLILLVTLGSIATALYALIQLFKLQPGQTIRDFFTAQNAA